MTETPDPIIKAACTSLANYLRTDEAVTSLVTEDDPYDEAEGVRKALDIIAKALDVLANDEGFDDAAEVYNQIFDSLSYEQARDVAAIAVGVLASTASAALSNSMESTTPAS